MSVDTVWCGVCTGGIQYGLTCAKTTEGCSKTRSKNISDFKFRSAYKVYLETYGIFDLSDENFPKRQRQLENSILWLSQKWIRIFVHEWILDFTIIPFFLTLRVVAFSFRYTTSSDPVAKGSFTSNVSFWKPIIDSLEDMEPLHDGDLNTPWSMSSARENDDIFSETDPPLPNKPPSYSWRDAIAKKDTCIILTTSVDDPTDSFNPLDVAILYTPDRSTNDSISQLGSAWKTPVTTRLEPFPSLPVPGYGSPRILHPPDSSNHDSISSHGAAWGTPVANQLEPFASLPVPGNSSPRTLRRETSF